ncbi:hypothetical protein VK97_15005, partial [Bacillus sp. LK10]
LNLNPIKRLAIVNKRAYPLHENNITQLEFGKQITDILLMYKHHRVENRAKSNLKKLSFKYEQSLIKVLGK